jgi:hypothetical protein
MSDIHKGRTTAELDGDFVVFLIGMRVNRWWKPHKWLPVFLAMPRMLRELYRNPDLGFLGAQSWFGRNSIMVQYWRSFDHLHRYARSRDHAHLPAWSAFYEAVGSSGDVGVWHETYLIPAGGFECVYGNMPRFGLARVGRHLPAAGRRATAAGRLRISDGDDAPVDDNGALQTQ